MGTIDKAKTKGKAKTAAKVAKAKGKIAAKCAARAVGRATAPAAVAILAGALAALSGCATSESAQPAKAQTQNNTFDDCIIIVATQCTVSNRIVRADGAADIPAVELFTQTQSLESSGTESFAQTATQTPTTDVKPDIDVKYNDAIGAAGSAAKSASAILGDAAASAVKGLVSGSSSGDCADGKCSETVSGDCSGGNCSPSK